MSSKANNIGKVILTRSNKPRSRGSNARKRIKGSNTNSSSEIPSLHEFMHRQKVIGQYRHFLKAINSIDDNDDKSRIGLINEVRNGYKSLIGEVDKLTITMAVKDVRYKYI